MSTLIPRSTIPHLPRYHRYIQASRFPSLAIHRQQHPSARAISSAKPAAQCDCSVDLSKLNIDRTAKLKGTAASYNTHVLISTGKSNWASKIEFEVGLAREIKGVLGRAGLNKGYEDLRHPDNVVLTTNSSYPPSPPSSPQPRPHSSTYIFPQNLYIPWIPHSPSPSPSPSPPPVVSPELAQFLHTYLLPTSPPASSLPYAPQLLHKPRKVHETHLLICTHNARDTRCGTIGPLLHKLFTECLSARGLLHPDDPSVSVRGKVRVGGISHVGGHKYAGNVIVYLPPGEGEWDRGGRGIWYGRVGRWAEVERIVKETVVEGRIIEELFRGGVGIR